MSRLDPAWLDLQYNNRARIPEHPQIFDRWARRSAEVRERLSRRLDIRYGDGPNETLDIFPASVADAPVLVFIHGGYWRSLDKSDFSFVAPSFVQRGAAVVIPNYALCPAVTIDQIAMQMAHALAWVHRNIALYGGDPGRIVVAGHSAGGHLAAMLVSCQWKAVGRDLPPDLVKARAIHFRRIRPRAAAAYPLPDGRPPAHRRRGSPAEPGALSGASGAAFDCRRARGKARNSCARTACSSRPGGSRPCRCARPSPSGTT